jgi:hypothetical protein
MISFAGKFAHNCTVLAAEEFLPDWTFNFPSRATDKKTFLRAIIQRNVTRVRFRR